MKNNILLLTKINFLATFDLSNSRKQKAKVTSLFVYIGFIFLIGLSIGTFMSITFNNTFKETGLNYIHSTLYLAGLVSILNYTTTIMAIKNVYAGKDYELLKSMPLRRSEIVSSKIISLYFVECLYALMFLLPNGVVNLIFSQDVSYLLFNFVLIILVPMLPIMFSTIVATVIAIISDRYKFGNIISIFLYLIAYAAIFVLSFLTGRANASNITNLSAIMWANPVLYFIRLAFENNMLFMLIFVGINILILIITVLVLALAYDYIHMLINSMKNNALYKRKELNNKTEFKTLYISEIRKITKSKLYFLNSFIGGLLAIFMSIMFIYTTNSLKETEYAHYINDYFYIASVAVMFSIGLNVPASFLISAEGKNFWMIKSYPINYKKFLNAKLLTSITFTLPFTIISCIILSIFIRTSLYNLIMFFLISIIYTLFVNVLALRLNLAFPKFKWINESEIVKNSASIIASTFIDIGIIVIISGMLVGFSFINPILATTISLSSILFLLLFFYFKTITKANYIIENYENL